MVLSNGTMQINNFRDHSKMILCPLLGALTTMGGAAGRSMKTHRLSLMEKGLSADMNEKLKYALEKVTTVIDLAMKRQGRGGVEEEGNQIADPLAP